MRIKLDRKAMRDLLRSPELLADVEERARRIAQTAGDGHGVRSEVGRNRVRAAVVTESFEAARAEARSRNLTRAIDAGR
jgi:phosphosulfolactate synthase (CoM biosynthesis protein A)